MIAKAYFFGGLLPRPGPEGLPVFEGAFSRKVEYVCVMCIPLKGYRFVLS